MEVVTPPLAVVDCVLGCDWTSPEDTLDQGGAELKVSRISFRRVRCFVIPRRVGAVRARVDLRSTLVSYVDSLATNNLVALSSAASGVVAVEQAVTHVLHIIRRADSIL